MNAESDQSGTKSGILLDTKNAFEEINLTWRLANYSQLFDIMDAAFSLQNSSTSWNIRLVDKRCIFLRRFDGGEPVNDDLKCSLVTRHKTFQCAKFAKFLGRSSECDILSLDAYEYDEMKRMKKIPIEFENDLFELKCLMKVVGPAITKMVRSNDYLQPNLETLSGDLKRLLQNEEHCDATIVTGNMKIPVHKVILCARSRVFCRMFQSGMLESKNQVIELNDLDYDTIKDFITFLYSGEMKLPSIDKAMNFYYVADKFEMQDLREKCSSYLEFNLCIDEVCKVLPFAELYKDIKLKRAIGFFIQMHSREVKSTDNWRDFIQNHPKLASEL